MKTGKYILGCSFLLSALILPIYLTYFFYHGGRISMPWVMFVPHAQMIVIALGWFFVIDSDPKDSNWKFEKWLAKKFYKID